MKIKKIKFKGISQLIYDTINSCDLTMRKSMFRSIIFCGGNTSYPGFLERTIDEIKGLANTKVRGEGDQTKNNMSDVLSTCFTSVYVGGCVLANLNADKSLFWMHLDKYKELGALKLIQTHFS